MIDEDIKLLLLAEIENKKQYSAEYDIECDGCGGDIQEGDSFIFMGFKQKICNECQLFITTFLE